MRGQKGAQPGGRCAPVFPEAPEPIAGNVGLWAVTVVKDYYFIGFLHQTRYMSMPQKVCALEYKPIFVLKTIEIPAVCHNLHFT